MLPLKLTTLLATVSGKREVNYNPKTLSIEPTMDKATFYQWEARLCQCAYLSRMIYSPTEVLLRGIQFLDQGPDVMNDVITILENTLYKKQTFDSLFVSNVVPAGQTASHGQFFPKTGCAVLQFWNPNSKINNQKTCYVVFKGSSSVKDFASDLTILKTDLMNIPQMKGLKGTVHLGFYNHMKAEIDQILVAVAKYSTGCDQIYITGHSLGGAMATLCSLMLARAKELGQAMPPLHCVTFGAPNLFSDDARNAFNKYLVDGSLTYDRVTSDKDVIVPAPGLLFSHPGFSVLNTEFFPTKKSGRSMNIDEIRGVFLGQGNVVKQPGMGHTNELPADPVFWNLFEADPVAKTPSQRIAELGNRLGRRVSKPEFATFVGLTAGDVLPELTKAEADAMEKQDSSSMAADAANLKLPSGQEGGAFFESPAKVAYKAETVKQQPSKTTYQCYQKLAGGFCHASYMGIGFMAALRIPTVSLRGADGKLSLRPVRKLEPTKLTTFMGSVDWAPKGRYYAVPMAGGNRRKGKTVKNGQKKQRTRKVAAK